MSQTPTFMERINKHPISIAIGIIGSLASIAGYFSLPYVSHAVKSFFDSSVKDVNTERREENNKTVKQKPNRTPPPTKYSLPQVTANYTWLTKYPTTENRLIKNSLIIEELAESNRIPHDSKNDWDVILARVKGSLKLENHKHFLSHPCAKIYKRGLPWGLTGDNYFYGSSYPTVTKKPLVYNHDETKVVVCYSAYPGDWNVSKSYELDVSSDIMDNWSYVFDIDVEKSYSGDITVVLAAFARGTIIDPNELLTSKYPNLGSYWGSYGSNTSKYPNWGSYGSKSQHRSYVRGIAFSAPKTFSTKQVR